MRSHYLLIFKFSEEEEEIEEEVEEEPEEVEDRFVIWVDY